MAAGSIEMRATFHHCGRSNHQSCNHHRSLAKLSLQELLFRAGVAPLNAATALGDHFILRPRNSAAGWERLCVSKKSRTYLLYVLLIRFLLGAFLLPFSAKVLPLDRRSEQKCSPTL